MMNEYGSAPGDTLYDEDGKVIVNTPSTTESIVSSEPSDLVDSSQPIVGVKAAKSMFENKNSSASAPKVINTGAEKPVSTVQNAVFQQQSFKLTRTNSTGTSAPEANSNQTTVSRGTRGLGRGRGGSTLPRSTSTGVPNNNNNNNVNITPPPVSTTMPSTLSSQMPLYNQGTDVLGKSDFELFNAPQIPNSAPNLYPASSNKAMGTTPPPIPSVPPPTYPTQSLASSSAMETPPPMPNIPPPSLYPPVGSDALSNGQVPPKEYTQLLAPPSLQTPPLITPEKSGFQKRIASSISQPYDILSMPPTAIKPGTAKSAVQMAINEFRAPPTYAPQGGCSGGCSSQPSQQQARPVVERSIFGFFSRSKRPEDVKRADDLEALMNNQDTTLQVWNVLRDAFLKGSFESADLLNPILYARLQDSDLLFPKANGGKPHPELANQRNALALIEDLRAKAPGYVAYNSDYSFKELARIEFGLQ